jgi:hypothetical protein
MHIIFHDEKFGISSCGGYVCSQYNYKIDMSTLTTLIMQLNLPVSRIDLVHAKKFPT